MFRLILALLLFLSSLLTILPVPFVQVWYLGVAASEFCWVGLVFATLTLIWSLRRPKYRRVAVTVGVLSILLFCFPIVGAYRISSALDQRLAEAFDLKESEMTGFHQAKPYSFFKMMTGDGSMPVDFKTYNYAGDGEEFHTLNYYHSLQPGIKPCLIVVHGGSWAKGTNHELANVNSYIANAGYQVISINYRLAPQFPSPAQQDDLKSAIVWTRQHASELQIDTMEMVLMGRSAGGQIVLDAAYTLHDPGIKGVISFYGPTDMVWSYDHPDNPLIMDSKQVVRNFLGGAPDEVPDRYVAESAMQHANASSVPTLLVHGRNDAHVAQEQSWRLKAQLDSLHVKNFFLAIPWGTHGCEYKLSTPSGQLSAYAVERMLYAVTRKER